MNSMKRKMARALFEEWNGVGRWDSIGDAERIRWDFMALAALKEMKEPTRKMVNVVSANWGRRTWAEFNEVIDAAIDAETL